MIKRLDVIAIVVLGLMLVGSTAQVQGDTKYFCADTDNTWSGNSGQNWRTFAGEEDCRNGTRVDAPTAADRAIIVGGKICNIDSAAVADSLDVESSATLNIESGNEFNSLTLDDDGANGSTIDGTLNLQGEDSLLAFEDNNQTIDGTGKIVGQHNSAKITITALETLTNEMTIEGQLLIDDDTMSGTFLNYGTVHANVAGTLEISTNSFDRRLHGALEDLHQLQRHPQVQRDLEYEGRAGRGFRDLQRRDVGRGLRRVPDGWYVALDGRNYRRGQ